MLVGLQPAQFPVYEFPRYILNKLTLYSRAYCHLCDDMLTALQGLRNEFDFSVTVLDVDADMSLVERYDELVPVLVGIKGGVAVQLCHYFLDAVKVRTFLAGSQQESANPS